MESNGGKRSGRAGGLGIEEKRRLVEKLLRERSRQGAGVARRADPAAPAPLSPAQEQLWVADQLAPGSAQYNMDAGLRLRGPLDLAALTRAVNRLVERHEPLRIRFFATAEGPQQRVIPAAPVSLPLEDLSTLPEVAQAAAAERLRAEEAARPIDLVNGLPFRTRLIRLSGQEHLLLLTLHHLVADDWSMNVLGRDLAALYRAEREGLPSGLPPLPVQYADFAAWQRERLTPPALEGQLAYWRRTLGGGLPPLTLPADRPRPPTFRHRAARATLRLTPAQVRRLTVFARERRTTLFVALVAAFQALLHRYAGQDTVCVGTTAANRAREELADLVGLFLNTYVLRADFEAKTTFASLVDQVRERSLSALENQDVPFARVVEAVQTERNPAYAPVFQALLTLQTAPRSGLSFGGGLEATPDNRGAAEIGIDLGVAFDDDAGDGGLTAVIDFSADLYEPETIAGMAESFGALIDALLDAPQAPISAAALLSPRLRQRRDTAFRAELSEASPPTVLEAFAQQVARWPDRIAARLEDRVLTYAELDSVTTRLARALWALGVRREDRVALHLGRSLEWLLGTLAVWKAGAATVPLDLRLPRERVLRILANTGARLLLCNADLAAPASLGLPVLRVDDEEAWAGHARTASPLPPPPALEQAACILFTSGSSGQPKGVVVPHRGLFGLGRGWRVCGVTEESVILQFSSPSFDVSLGELTMALVNGAALCIAPDALSGGGAPLAAYLRRHHVTHLAMGPQLIAMLDPASLPELRTVISGGEQLPPELVSRFVPRCRFFNAYGPTEATNTTTLGECQGSDAVPPIGIALPGTAARVLDARLQPVPEGVVGELYIGGDGVARGYLEDPAQTAERFLPDPWNPGRRMYRTGDLVRLGRDGRIRFVGRRDNQIKIRGFRIELEEIEAELKRQPGVREAVVALFEQEGVGKRLCAYVQPAGGALDAEALRTRLAERLPDYMVPTVYQQMDRWPLTVTMKIDRRALPPPQPAAARPRRASRPPSGRYEQVVADAWRALLGVAAPVADDDFFLLGGHSLLATQLIGRLQDALGVQLELRLVFEHSTLERLAAALAAVVPQGQQGLPPVTPAPGDQPVPLTFAQQRLWFLDRLEPGSAAYVLPGAVRLRGALVVPALASALSWVLARHEALRTVFTQTPEGPRQRVRPPGPIDLAQVDLAPLPPEAREAALLRRCREEAMRPFDLERGPLLRATLLRAAADDHVLMITTHHMVSDGWSMGLLLSDLGEAYRAALAGRAPEAAPLPVGYRDFAVWQSRHLAGEALAGQIAHWRERLAGAPEALALPTDRPRPPVQSARGHHLPVRFPAALREGLLRIAQEENATLFMASLACFKLLLSLYAGQEDVSVGTSVAGRTRAETEGIVGFFVNTLVLRTQLEGARTYREILRRVRETTLDALAHQDAPFERIVEAVSPARDLGRSPLFQVAFDMLAAPPPLTLPGCEATPFEFETDTSKFDLTLGLEESAAGLDGYVEFSADLFERSTVLRMMDHLERLMGQVVATPDAPLSSLRVLSPAEERALLVDYNQTPPLRPLERLYTQLFEDQAARTPERTAVSSGEEAVCYGDLNARANGLAHRLVDLGAGPERVVALLDERGPRLLAAMLGVLKSGAAILQLDPYQPAQRLAQVLRQSRASVVASSAPFNAVLDEAVASLPPEARPARVSLDRAAPPPREDNPPARAVPDNICYLIFTSGSTGQPKGAMLDHRGMLNHLWAEIDQLGLGAEDVIGQTASQNFDISVWQFLVALMLGGRTEIISDEVVRDPPRLLSELSRRGVTLFEPVPSLYRPVLEEAVRLGAHRPALERLRWVMLCGEAIPADLCRDSFRLYPDVSLLNAYGPAECSDDVIQHLMNAPPEGGFTPLGRPILGMQAYLLDGHLRPVPIGVAGELFLAGVGVGRGYYDDPVRTAAAFVPNPFSEHPGARMYRTGDMARFHPDGRLEFLGRVDHQVKVNGHRIELGDVEAALGSHPAVRECVAVARVDKAGQKRLVAYFALHGGKAAEPAELRRHVQERLPAYMIPSRFVLLEALPLSANGKVDRKRLPDPDSFGRESEFSPPRTATERTLAEIWKGVLALEGEVGSDDNFFNLGGHSMLAVQMLTRAREALGREVPLRAVFEAQTLAALALRFEAPAAPEPQVCEGLLVALQPSGAQPPLYCIHPGFGGALAYQALAALLGPDQPVFGLTAPELAGLPSPATLADRVAHYASVIRGHRPEGPYRLAGYSDGALLAYELARRLEADGGRVEQVALIDRPTPALAAAAFGGARLPARPTALDRLNEALGLMEDPTYAALTDEPARWDHVLALGRRFGMVPSDASRETLAPTIAALASMQDQLAGWTPGPYSGPVTVFSSQFSVERLRDPALGWGEALGRAVQGVTIPGGHDTIVRLPHVRVLAEALQDAFAQPR